MWVKTGTEAVITDKGHFVCDTCNKRVNGDTKIIMILAGQSMKKSYDFCNVECFNNFIGYPEYLPKIFKPLSVRLIFPYNKLNSFKQIPEDD